MRRCSFECDNRKTYEEDVHLGCVAHESCKDVVVSVRRWGAASSVVRLIRAFGVKIVASAPVRPHTSQHTILTLLRTRPSLSRRWDLVMDFRS